MKKSKILLIALYCDGMWQIHEEIGICYIASYLRKHGYEVILKSCEHGAIDYDDIVRIAPDVIGMPIYDANKLGVYEACAVLRRILPESTICAGGAVPTCYEKDVLKECREIDIVVKGEGEVTFLELIAQLDSGGALECVQGIVFRQGNDIITNVNRPLIHDMNALPPPSRDILEQMNIKVAQISTSRGCTAHCSFCASKLYWTKWRGRGVDQIIDEINYIVARYRIRAFNFIDGSFEDPGNDFNRILGIANGILDRGLVIAYYVHMRAEFFNKAPSDLIEKLKKSGLVTVCIGIESGDADDLRLYNKNASLDEIDRAISVLKKHDINIDPGFINFNPYTTVDRLKKNIAFLEKHGFASNPDYIIKSSRIYRGTALYKKVAMDGLMRDTEVCECSFIFADDKIKLLYEYVFLHLKGGHPSDVSVFRAICHGSSFNSVGICCMKRLFQQFLHSEAYEIAVDYEKGCRHISAQVNTNIALWFKEMLNLAETGWDKSMADKISFDHLPKTYLKDAATSFQYQKERLKKQLFKLEMENDLKELLQYMIL